MELIERLKEKNLYITNKDEINNIRTNLKQIQNVSTGMCGTIEVYDAHKQSNQIVIEEDGKDNFYIRLIRKEDVERFIQERMAIYDKMWDGCGCKVNYHEKWE